jgi:single-strand DNA-binding protein
MRTINNYINLVGNTGQEVELVNFESGSKKATVRLATNDYYKNTKGEFVKNTSWHTVVAWGKNAEMMAKSLEKGSQVIIKGMLNYRSYADANGAERIIPEIIVHEFMKVTQAQPKPHMVVSAPAPF